MLIYIGGVELIQSGIQIGSAANLLLGFKPLWNTSENGSSPLFAPPKSPITITEENIVTRENALFGYPLVTLHDNVESLLNDLFEYVILPFKGEERSFSMPSGPLILNSRDRDNAITTLSNYIGVDLSKDYSYMLVKLRRFSGISDHEVLRKSGAKTFDRMVHLTKEGRLAMSRLRPGKRLSFGLAHDASISENQAEGYLNFFYEYGTHFISRIYYGDYIFQVFAYNKDNFTCIKEAFAEDSIDGALTGLQAMNYNYYTNNRLVSEYGAIVIHSGDSKLEKTLADKAWYDERYVHGNSIFAAFTNHALAQTLFLSQFDEILPIGFELTPLNRFIEIFRSFSWQRVLKGALLQRYGNSIKLAVPRLNKDDIVKTINNPIDELLTQAAMPSGEEVLLYENIMDMGKLSLESKDKVKNIIVMSNAMQFADKTSVNLPGRSVNLISHCIYAAAESWNMPELVVTDEAFTSLSLHFEKMQGVMRINNLSRSKSSIVLDGFCYTDNGTRVFLKKLRESVPQRILEKVSDGMRQLIIEQMLLQEDDQKNSLVYQGDNKSYVNWFNRITNNAEISTELAATAVGTACGTAIFSVDFLEDKINSYNQITRLFVSSLNRSLNQKSDSLREVDTRNIGSLLLDYFYSLYKLRTEITENSIKSSDNKLYASRSIIEDINNMQFEEAKFIKERIFSDKEYNDFSKLAIGIRFQQKQINYIFKNSYNESILIKSVK